MTHDNLVAFVDVEEFDGARGASFPVHSDGCIHHGRPHLDLLAVNTDESLLVRHYIKVRRENAVGRGGSELRIGAFGDFGAMLSQSQNQFIERLARLCRDLDARKALVGTLLADLDLADFEIRAVSQNLIEHFRQDQRINDVSPQLNRFRKHRRNLPMENHRASEAKMWWGFVLSAQTDR